jgi:hypothetical protein
MKMIEGFQDYPPVKLGFIRPWAQMPTNSGSSVAVVMMVYEMSLSTAVYILEFLY